ncbi:MAG TPA: hypothetical protein VJ204_09130 [Solirubrobacterales bacterium]|nr:hypothetical protein [Solirubrobacterales bacterium]
MLSRRRNRSSPGKAEEGKPLLAVDVDGVVLLLGGGDESAPGAAVQFELIDGIVHRVSIGAGDCLRRLSGHFELVWATGWQARANDHFPALLGLPRLPYVDFGGAAKFGSAHWKLEPLDAYAKGRPLAWVDDNFDDICFEWAAAREEPTLLVPVDPRHGLRDEEAETLLTWGRPFAVPAPG